MIVAPRNGMIVINPATGKALPADGADVELNTYWFRRHKDGDIELKDAEPQPVAAPVETPVEIVAEKPKRKKSTDEGK